MKLSEMIKNLGMEAFTPSPGDPEISGGYCSDMLSDVIANAEKDAVWITIQTHINVAAVAALKDLAAVIISSGRRPAEDTLETAAKKNVCILGTRSSSFDTVGALHAAGVRGSSKS